MSDAPKSQSERLWAIGGGIAALAMVLIGYFLIIAPQRSATDDVRGQISAAQSANSTLQAHINALREQSKSLPRFQAELTALQGALPSTDGVTTMLRTFQSMAGSTGTTVSDVTFGAPTAVTAGPPGAASSAARSATSVTSAKPGSTAGATTGATTASLYSIPVTAQINGTPANLNRFLVQLQTVQSRAVLITGVTEGANGQVNAGSGAGATTLQLTMQTFVAPTSTSPSTGVTVPAK